MEQISLFDRHAGALADDPEIAVVGVFDHVELWKKEVYLADRETGDETYLVEA